jgi:hypothetical protein
MIIRLATFAVLLLALLGGFLLMAAPSRAETRKDPVEDKIATYVQALKSKDPLVRKQVARALAELGPRAKVAVPALRAALLDQDAGVQAAAAAALDKIAPAASNRPKNVEEAKLARMAAEMAALRDELARCRRIVEDRQAVIQKLQQKSADLLARTLAAQNAEQAARARAEALRNQVEALTRKLAKLEGSGKIPAREGKNPPPDSVKGVVTKVSKDGLVEISIGTDVGIKAGHTLEVYRLKPKPEYLGTLQIVNAGKTSCIARLQKGSTKRSALQKGDEVAGSIMPR